MENESFSSILFIIQGKQGFQRRAGRRREGTWSWRKMRGPSGCGVWDPRWLQRLLPPHQGALQEQERPENSWSSSCLQETKALYPATVTGHWKFRAPRSCPSLRGSQCADREGMATAAQGTVAILAWGGGRKLGEGGREGALLEVPCLVGAGDKACLWPPGSYLYPKGAQSFIYVQFVSPTRRKIVAFFHFVCSESVAHGTRDLAPWHHGT